MQTFETAAVISLIDHLSGPLAKLSTHVGASGTRFDKHAEAMVAAGKKMTYAYTLPAVAITKHLMDSALEFDKVENTLQGVLMTRHKTMNDLTQTHKEYAKSQRVLIDQAAELAYKNSGGMVDVLEYRKSVMSGVKAGFDVQSSTALAGQSFDLSLAGRIDQHEATDQLITLANSFHLKLKDAQGKALPTEQLNKAFGSMADLLTTMSTNANMTEQQAFESLKLSAPLAHLTRMNPYQLGALSETMAESGFKGSEAGVALRSVMQAFTAPKSTAVPMLRDAGIDINKFRTFRPDYDLGPAHFEKQMRGLNYDVNHAQVLRAYQQAHRMADASGGALTFEGALTDTLSPLIRTKSKKHLPVAPGLAQKRVMDFISQGAETVDMFGAILEMRDKHLTGGQLKKFMEGRQIPRALSFLGAPEPGQNDVFGTAMKRSFGDDWEEQVRKFHKAGESYGEALEHLVKVQGAARTQALEHADNIEGGYRRIASSFKHLEERLYKAGVFDAAANGLRHLSDIVDKIADQSPKMLKFEAGAVAFVAAMGPLLLIGGRMLQFAKAAGVAGKWLTETPEAAAAKAKASATAEALGKGGKAINKVELPEIEAKATPKGLTGGFKPVVGGLVKGGIMGLIQTYALDYVEGKVDEALGMTPGQKTIRDEGVVAAWKRVSRHFGPWGAPGEDKVKPPAYHVDTPPMPPSWSVFGKDGFLKLPQADRIETDKYSLTGGFTPRSVRDDVSPTKSAGVAADKLQIAPVSVSGDIKGEATIMSTVRIDVSPELRAVIDSARQVISMGLSGKLGQTMKGSNAAIPSVPSGLSAFKPSVSGR